MCQRNKIDMNSQILKVFLALPSYFWKMIEEIWTEILLKKKINENKCFVSFKSHWLFFIFLKVWQFVLLLQLKKLNHNDHNNHNNLNFRDFSSISKKIFNGQ